MPSIWLWLSFFRFLVHLVSWTNGVVGTVECAFGSEVGGVVLGGWGWDIADTSVVWHSPAHKWRTSHSTLETATLIQTQSQEVFDLCPLQSPFSYLPTREEEEEEEEDPNLSVNEESKGCVLPNKAVSH